MNECGPCGVVDFRLYGLQYRHINKSGTVRVLSANCMCGGREVTRQTLRF